MKKAIAIVAACLGLAAFAGGGGKSTAGEAKGKDQPAAAAATDGGTAADAGTPAKTPAKK
jgi:hypothetical protein